MAAQEHHAVGMIPFWRPQDKDGWLGNWHTSQFDLDGLHFSCVEQWIMYSKAVLFGDTKSAEKLIHEKDPKKMKAMGRKYT